ncbi:MAG: amino-acid N-acetyltransferase [Spirochaetaceae bacterium]
MDETKLREQVELIREAFLYAHRFQGRRFVFQIEAGVITGPGFSSLVRDIALLRQLGIHIVIVAGAASRIDEVLTRYGVEWRIEGELRVVSPEATPFIKMAAFDTANRVMTLLAGQRANAVIGNWVRARAVGVRNGVDYGDAGIVERINTDMVRQVLDQGTVPIFPCIGWNASGQPYNISSRELAVVISGALVSSKLFFLTDGRPPVGRDRYTLPSGVEGIEGDRISRMTVAEAREFVQANEAACPHDAGVALVRYACEAAGLGVERTHIIDGTVEGVILKEIFSNMGVGTMVHANVYQSLRRMERDDVPDVLRLMKPLVAAGYLVPRNEEDLVAALDDFIVYEVDGSIHGCGALHPYGEQMAEVAALAVDESYKHIGIGRRIVAYLLERARERGLRRVFALTTRTSDWFLQFGFRRGDTGDIPESRREQYDRARNSRIYLYELGGGNGHGG